MCPRIDPSWRRSPTRRGLTLIELLMATLIMSIMAATLGGMAYSVQQTVRYSESHGSTLQNARVTLDRIQRMVSSATANADYPGVWVVYETSGSFKFPDTLIIWHPSGTPANPSGLPLVKECIFVCPDPASPGQLVEITAPNDSRTIPLNDTLNTSSWRTTISGIKTASTSVKMVLTTLLRTAPISLGSTTTVRGGVRFAVELHPTSSEWTSYKAGTLGWSNMGWPQNLYSPSLGMRQVQVRTELQMNTDSVVGETTVTEAPLAFFGSAVLLYQLTP